MPDSQPAPLVLVTGATGYIGGRLVPRLSSAGCRVRCLVRDSSRLEGCGWQGKVEIVAADVLDPASLVAAMNGVRVAYDLIHSMGAGSDFEQRDLDAARNFSRAAKSAGVERIIYLRALGETTPTSQGDLVPVILKDHDGMIVEHRQQIVTASPAQTFAEFTSLGGKRGWLYMNWAWKIRGAADRMIGGVGLRRGRRESEKLRVGDALDFWRVESIEQGQLLRLRAEMKVPGKAWLQFRAIPHEGGGTLLEQTAVFAPKGLAGLLYWYALYPVHRVIFSGLIDRLGRSAAS